MSNDLISRSALIEKIKKWLPSDPCGKEQSVEEVVATDLAVSMLMEIEEAPTAYDVDQVCEEIKHPNNYTIMSREQSNSMETILHSRSIPSGKEEYDKRRADSR